MKKNQFNKRYFDFKNKIVYFKGGINDRCFRLLPSIYLFPSPFFKNKQQDGCVNIAFDFLVFEFAIVISDKVFKDYIA